MLLVTDLHLETEYPVSAKLEGLNKPARSIFKYLSQIVLKQSGWTVELKTMVLVVHPALYGVARAVT